jgi:hypothetical protein
MPKVQSTPGGRITCIFSEAEEKQIIDYLLERCNLFTLSSIERKKFMKKASKFSAFNNEISK